MNEGVPVYIDVEEVDIEAQKRDMISFFGQHDILKRDVDQKANTEDIKAFKDAFTGKYSMTADVFYKMIKSFLNSKILIVSEIKTESGQKNKIIKPFSINGCG